MDVQSAFCISQDFLRNKLFQSVVKREAYFASLLQRTILSLCCIQLKCSVMIFLLQGHVQQYQLYHIRGVSQERNVVTEKARNSKERSLDTIKSVLKQNMS